MSRQLKTVTEHVWKNVTRLADRPAAKIRNQGPAENHLVATATSGMMPHATLVSIRPEVLEISWAEYGLMVAEAIIFLRESGVRQGDRVAMLGWDTLEYQILNRGVQSLGAITVPIYPNTGPDQVSYILKDSGATMLLVDNAEEFKKVKRDLLPVGKMKEVVFADALRHLPDYTGGRLAFGERRKLVFRREAHLEFARMRQMYDHDNQLAGETIEPLAVLDGISTLIYTSGSTGTPKGVIITHRNMSACFNALEEMGFTYDENDLILHYLPFGHVYGKINGLELAERYGVTSAFCRPEPQHLKEALVLYEPTLLLGVPRVWNRFQKEIMRQLQEAAAPKPFWNVPGCLQSLLVRLALTAKKPGLKRTICDALVFRKVRSRMGARRLRLCLSGSAAIPTETIDFFNLIGLNLREGYGLTETCGGIVVNTLDDYVVGSLGKPAPGLEYKLVPVPEYTEPNTGVLYVRGDMIFQGYWNMPEKNKEVFDADGWFNTGDIVHIDERGFFWYRGRLSRQKKLDTGKFYSEDRIQVALEGSALISAAVAVGEGKPFVGALIFPDLAVARKLAGDAPEPDKQAAYYATHPVILKEMQKAVDEGNERLIKEYQAGEWETVKQWEMVAEVPTVENELLTPTLKIRPEKALARYPQVIAAIYAKKRNSSKE